MVEGGIGSGSHPHAGTSVAADLLHQTVRMVAAAPPLLLWAAAAAAPPLLWAAALLLQAAALPHASSSEASSVHPAASPIPATATSHAAPPQTSPHTPLSLY